MPADEDCRIIIEIAGRLDLNSLDSLSRTCRQVHAGLLQYRAALIARSLRCVNEGFSRDPSWKPAGTYHGRCARDLVGECRRCGVVVCRVSQVHDTERKRMTTSRLLSF